MQAFKLTMVTNETFKLLGPISIVLVWAAITTLLTKWPRHREHSISWHAAQSRQSFLMMAIAQTFSIPMFMVFSVAWLAPQIHLGTMFVISSIASGIGFFVAAWVPDTKGKSYVVHEAVAYTSAFAMIPTTLSLATAHYLSWFAIILSRVTVTFMIAMFTLLATYPKAKQEHLILQSIYIALFHFSILSAAFI